MGTAYWARAITAIIIIGIVNSWVSRAINVGRIGPTAMMPVALASGAVWGWMSRGAASLALASTVYDIVYAVAYIAGLATMGVPVTPIQLLGVGISVAGIVVMGMG